MYYIYVHVDPGPGYYNVFSEIGMYVSKGEQKARAKKENEKKKKESTKKNETKNETEPEEVQNTKEKRKVHHDTFNKTGLRIPEHVVKHQ